MALKYQQLVDCVPVFANDRFLNRQIGCQKTSVVVLDTQIHPGKSDSFHDQGETVAHFDDHAMRGCLALKSDLAVLDVLANKGFNSKPWCLPLLCRLQQNLPRI